MTASPKVSILIPVYMGEKLIGRTLDSLAAQRFGDFEVLCIDDHSSDGSAALIQERAKSDPRIRYLKTPSNLGCVPKVLNAARDQVRGCFFAYSSQDDYFSRDWLEKMISRTTTTNVDAVVPDLEFITADGRTLKKLSGWSLFEDQLISGEKAFLLSLDWTIPGNALWRTELFKSRGFFDFGMYADEYTARVYFLNCRQVAFCTATFYYYQGNADAITKKLSPCRLDYAYNQFRVWELVTHHAPLRAPAFARSVVRDLFEAIVMASSERQLRSEQIRLDQAIASMQSARFREDLRRAFGPREKPKQALALALLNFAAARVLTSYVVRTSRRIRCKVN